MEWISQAFLAPTQVVLWRLLAWSMVEPLFLVVVLPFFGISAAHSRHVDRCRKFLVQHRGQAHWPIERERRRSAGCPSSCGSRAPWVLLRFPGALPSLA